MSSYRTIRVYPDGDFWVAKKDGASKASLRKNTKEEAVRAAREIALNQGLVIIIHGKDGRIQKTVRPQENDNDGCFITSACIKYFSLKDNCYQLQTLRDFRDNYLLKSEADQALVSQYYSIAPGLVKLLEADINRTVLYEEIFRQINIACLEIENKRYEKAKLIYKETVIKLMQHFKTI